MYHGHSVVSVERRTRRIYLASKFLDQLKGVESLYLAFSKEEAAVFCFDGVTSFSAYLEDPNFLPLDDFLRVSKRVVLPKSVVSYLDLSRKVAFVGNKDHLELWKPSCLEKAMDEVSRREYDKFLSSLIY